MDRSDLMHLKHVCEDAREAITELAEALADTGLVEAAEFDRIDKTYDQITNIKRRLSREIRAIEIETQD